MDETRFDEALAIGILVDGPSEDESRELTLRVGWQIQALCDGGPWGPIEEVVILEYDDGEQVFVSRVPMSCSNKRSVYGILRGAIEALHREAGLYPRIAALHPRFAMTGLSAPDGGWIDGEAYHILDPVVTIDADEPGTKREGGT